MYTSYMFATKVKPVKLKYRAETTKKLSNRADISCKIEESLPLIIKTAVLNLAS